jgi:hypothetical protein
VKEYKQIYCDIEYQVFELSNDELDIHDFVKLVVKPLLHHPRFRNCIIKKSKDDKIFKWEIYSNGMHHNEYGPAVISVEKFYKFRAWYLNGKKYHWRGLFTTKNRITLESEYKNEVRRLRLQEIL